MFVQVVVVIALDAGDRAGGRGLARADAAARQRHHEKRPGRRGRERRRRCGRGADPRVADGARADEVARGIKRTAHEIAEQRRRGAVVEIGVGGAPGLLHVAHAANVGITGELAVARAEEFAVIDVDHRDQTGLAAVEKFAAAHGGTPVLGAAAGGETAAQGHIVAVVVAPQNRVHHAGGGIGAVDRRSAVTQHFDALDRGGGKLVHVDRERGHTALGLADRVRREPAAVDEHERVARADAAEVERGVVTAGVGPEDVGLGEREDAPVRQELEQLGRRGRGANVEVVEIEHGNRQRGLLVDAADVRTGDGEGFEFNRLARRCWRRCGLGAAIGNEQPDQRQGCDREPRT